MEDKSSNLSEFAFLSTKSRDWTRLSLKAPFWNVSDPLMIRKETRLARRALSFGLGWPEWSGSKYFMLSTKCELWATWQETQIMGLSSILSCQASSAFYCPSQVDSTKLISTKLKLGLQVKEHGAPWTLPKSETTTYDTSSQTVYLDSRHSNCRQLCFSHKTVGCSFLHKVSCVGHVFHTLWPKHKIVSQAIYQHNNNFSE